jgi:GH24 family phage-related lysozyme (muramidase)
MSRQLSAPATRKTSWLPVGARAQPAFLFQRAGDRRPAGEQSEVEAPAPAAGGWDFGRLPVHAPPRANAAGSSTEFAAACPLALASPQRCPFGGACHACPARVQPKLAISQPGDEFEQEADRVAAQVMRMPDDGGSTAGLGEPREGVPTLQRADAPDGAAAANPGGATANRPPRPSTAASQMTSLLSTAQSSAAAQRGRCYAAAKRNIKAAGGYGDILDVANDERFAGHQVYALQFSQAVAANGAASLALEAADDNPMTAEPGSLLVLRGHADLHINETYGDISVVGGKNGSNLICYNDGMMILPGPSSLWEAGGKFKGVVAAIYKPVSRAAVAAAPPAANPTPPAAASTTRSPPAATIQKKSAPPRPLHDQGPAGPGGARHQTARPMAPAVIQDALRPAGRPLDAATRAFMEPRFGHDFSRVRVHTDVPAADSARAVDALAYTVGHQVVFGTGQYAPATTAGQRLLAHELAHVVQQTGGFPAGRAARAARASRANGRGRREDDRSAAAVSSPAHSVGRAPALFVGRQNVPETAAVLHTGTVRGSGLQFFPLQVAGTRSGPVSGAGGLLGDSRNRLSVIVGQSMTLQRIAELILPLWNSATPFTPAGAAGPVVTPPLSADVLARGLLVYNRYYLRLQTQPAPAMTGWQGGLRFPLPVELDANGEGVVNKDLIQNLAAEFDNAWEPLLGQPAGAVAAPAPADLRQTAAAFLTSHPSANERGVALAARAITNPVEAQPLLAEILVQLGADAFAVALAFMDASVNSQIALLASQRAGAGVLGAIRAALAAAPATPTTGQQASLARANQMLGLVTAIVPREMPFLQPTAVSAAGVHMIAGFEGFCGNLYDDAMPGCGRGRGNCTIGFGHLVHLDPCDGRASEVPFAGGVTRPQAEQLLAGELAGFANRVHNQVTAPLSQQQFDAVVSFVFNTGRLNALLPDLNANQPANIPGVMNQFIRGRVGAQHIVMPGLVNRRAAEAQLFSTGQYPP